MADIKTKDNAKGTIRTIDKAAVATQRMKQAYIATKEKAERSVNANSSSAEEYASDKLESGIDEVVHDGAYAFDKAGRKGVETTKENIRTAKDGIQRFKQQRAEQSLRKQASQNTSSAIKTVDKAEKTIKQSATSSGKKTIKFAGKEATKTAQKSVKKRSCCRHCCRRLGCGGGYYCSVCCRINCRFCVWYLLFGRGFRHGNVYADSRSGNQSRI